MDWIRGKLTNFGLFLALAGVISSALYIFEYNLRVLMWVDLWGPGVGWAIRIACIVGGLILAFVANLGDHGEDHDEDHDEALS